MSITTIIRSRVLSFSIAILAGAMPPALAAPVAVPGELAGWQDWALKGEEYRRCPLTAIVDQGEATNAESFHCRWPERLSLNVDARGGSFSQRWQVYAEDWIALPGDLEHWPRDVRSNGAPLAVVARDNLPQVRLTAGTYAITGRFAWSERPESIVIPAETALVDLTLDGQRVAQPERPDGNLWLGKRRTVSEANALEVQVYRKVSDQIPVELTTRVHLQVAGEGREELLARALPEGFTPTSIDSVLPARLEPDGRLRVQVRPGSYDVTLVARGASVAATLKRPAIEPKGAKWAQDEVWSFEGYDRLRVAAAEGAESIDPKQASVPGEWQGLPAFRMAAGATLTVNERSRGLGAGDDNRLRLSRTLWLDFDHKGITAVDQIGGNLRRDWRLDMAAPFTLASARMGNENLLVTKTPGAKDSDKASTGVELRAPQFSLVTTARSPSSGGALPASGWTTRFDSVQGAFILPPGHRLLAAIGPDSAPGTWWSRWTLWNLFGLCIVVAVTYRLAGRVVAGVALLALALTYQEAPGMVWLWANVLAAIAIARAVPEGKFRRVVGGYRALSLVVLGLALLPMVWSQVRSALYPQIEDRSILDYVMVGGANKQVYPESKSDARERYQESPLAVIPVEEGYAVDAAAPAAPPAESPQAVMENERAKINITSQDRMFKKSDVMGGLNRMQVVQRYAPGTQLQTGPGIPDWRYNVYHYRWSGPVEPDDSVRFLYIGPFLLGLWRIVGAAMLAAWFVALLQNTMGWELRIPWPRSGIAASVVPLLGVAVLSVLALFASPSNAASTPDSALLAELKNRLTEPPKCAPTCAEITAARVTVGAATLDVTLDISALTTVAVPLPQAADRWQIENVSVDGVSSLALRRAEDNSVWIALRTGAHTVRMSGRLSAVDSLQLAFPRPPRTVDVTVSGWKASGVDDGALPSGSLELTRLRGATASGGAPRVADTDFPAFVRVQRTVLFDMDWSISTYVQRLAPEHAAISVAVPIIAGEAVLTPGIKVTPEKTVLAALAAGQDSISWNSGLPRSEKLELSLPANPSRIEVWNFIISPQWHVDFEGQPAVSPEDGNPSNWVFQYYPRPGEKLSLRITRPQAAEGATLAIDRVQHSMRVGTRSSDATLDFSYRSTQGGRHTIKLPKDARVQTVSVDGQPTPLRPNDGVLSIGLLPGAHRVIVDWQSPNGAAIAGKPDAVDLGADASNVTTVLQLPEDRWALFALGRGAGVGPAFLYWGEIVIFIAVAWLLGRWQHSPLRFHEWLLLGLGLSTLSWFVLVLVGAWLFAFHMRGRAASESIARWRFNLRQVALALLAVIAISSLVFSGIRYGFLSYPDMGVVGGTSGGFGWFRDVTHGPLPQPLVISLPLWVYKTLIFAWALWVAIALTRWIRTAWAAWTSGGFWRSEKPPAGTGAITPSGG